MKYIKKYQIYEESKYLKSILLSALLSIGISKSQAQQLQNDQPKLNVINTLIEYNKNPNIFDLQKHLSPILKDSNKFIHNYVSILPDKTIVLKPNFVKGLEVNINPDKKSIGHGYRVKYTINF